MIKELMLVPRVIHTGLFALWGIIAAFGKVYPVPYIGIAVFIISFSFIWQYVVLHHLMNALEITVRRVGILLWMLASAGLTAWGVHLLWTLDWLQGESLTSDFAWRMEVYLIAASCFVAGACARRAYQKHSAL
jgi:hypothetical protein